MTSRMHRVDMPAPRSAHSTCVCASCACCAPERADLIEATRDVFDAWMLGGSYWQEMTRQQPLHPSMQRLLDCCATLENRHHVGDSGAGWGTVVAPDADRAAELAGGLFAPPQPDPDPR